MFALLFADPVIYTAGADCSLVLAAKKPWPAWLSSQGSQGSHGAQASQGARRLRKGLADFAGGS